MTSDEIPQPQWHVARTHPQREGDVGDLIRRLTGFETYYPVFTKTVAHARRRMSVARPLFPRYVFVELDSRRQDVRPVLYCPGVAELLKSGTNYAIISEPLMLRIRKTEELEALKPARQSHGFETGQAVQIAVGPFASFPAQIAELDDKSREAVLLTCIFGRENRISVPYGHLAAVVSGAGPRSRT